MTVSPVGLGPLPHSLSGSACQLPWSRAFSHRARPGGGTGGLLTSSRTGCGSGCGTAGPRRLSGAAALRRRVTAAGYRREMAPPGRPATSLWGSPFPPPYKCHPSSLVPLKALAAEPGGHCAVPQCRAAGRARHSRAARPASTGVHPAPRPPSAGCHSLPREHRPLALTALPRPQGAAGWKRAG